MSLSSTPSPDMKTNCLLRDVIAERNSVTLAERNGSSVLVTCMTKIG